ncbi:MAG: hypothetical protein J6S85_19095 [Methanobrevibacter sp.]|nr:hypothetical protein [Methanobrevibacter sp.]
MMESQQHLQERNQIAASLGQDIVLDILTKYREQFISQLKTIIPTANDVLGLNFHRALGRIDALDFLISEGRRATKRDNK